MTTKRDVSDRLSAYSDSVFAVIVTIMVLQLRAPHSAEFKALFVLWPTAVSYGLSYLFVAVIWINHHHLTRLIRTPTLPLIWTNFVHLFVVSLLPFTTAWMADTKMKTIPVVVYGGLFVCADGAFNIFEHYVLRQTREISERGRRVARRRSVSSLMIFAAATLLAVLQPWIGFGLICTALILHLKPDIGSRRRDSTTSDDSSRDGSDIGALVGQERKADSQR